jgi:hypothetical protein
LPWKKSKTKLLFHSIIYSILPTLIATNRIRA